MTTITIEQRRVYRRRYRETRRLAGWSWLCIASRHELCSGLIGRLPGRPGGASERERCQCMGGKCHGWDLLAEAEA